MARSILEKIHSIAKQNKAELIQFLQDIIAIPSTSGNEEEVIKRMKLEMEKIGYDQICIDPFGNLIGRIGKGQKIIAIDGHCDTVGIGNADNWDFDPLKGRLLQGIIYGRGAADQKGGLASAIYAGKVIKTIGIPDDITLYIVASVLEEDFEGLCWKYIIEEDKIFPQVVILTEPTNLGIKMGHRGRIEIKIETGGKSCHGSSPHLGENAIYKLSPIINDIQSLNQTLSSKSILGKGTVVVTDICSSAPSLCAVPDIATIHLDLKELPSCKQSRARIWVPDFDIRTYTGLKYPVQAFYPMWLMEKSDPVVDKAIKTYQILMNKQADVGVWSFSTNGVVTKGVWDIPTFGFGPGDEIYAHTAKDQVPVNDMIAAMSFYAGYILLK